MVRLSGKNMMLPSDSVLTFGKFESLHLGHQVLMNEILRRAREKDWISAVVSFFPNPRIVLGDPGYKPLFTSGERAYTLRRLGIDYMLELEFDRGFMETPPEKFCEMLFNDLRGRILAVGEGIRFGNGRAGSAAFLKDAAERYGAKVILIPHMGEPDKVSTSFIRALLAEHKMEDAAKLLGFPFFITGKVAHGEKIGRTLGFPTVNIETPPEKFLPPDGVYATLTRMQRGEKKSAFRSVTNIGIKPTFNQNGGHRTVESFLIDFTGEIYGEELMTEFISYIRPERKFENADALREQIGKDMSTRETIGEVFRL